MNSARDGILRAVESAEIVPGGYIMLEPGFQKYLHDINRILHRKAAAAEFTGGVVDSMPALWPESTGEIALEYHGPPNELGEGQEA